MERNSIQHRATVWLNSPQIKLICGLIKLEIHIRTTFLSCKTLLILRWNKSDRCTVRNPYVTKPNKSWRNWGKNLAKLGEDTLGAPATMLVNFFSFSQRILKIHAWAVPKKAPLWWKHWNLAEILTVKVEIPLFTPFVLPTHFHQQVGRGTWLAFDNKSCVWGQISIYTICIHYQIKAQEKGLFET